MSWIKTDALDERGQGCNQRHWLIMRTVLSLGESRYESNGLETEQEAGIEITALRGAHILLQDR